MFPNYFQQTDFCYMDEKWTLTPVAKHRGMQYTFSHLEKKDHQHFWTSPAGGRHMTNRIGYIIEANDHAISTLSLFFSIQYDLWKNPRKMLNTGVPNLPTFATFLRVLKDAESLQIYVCHTDSNKWITNAKNTMADSCMR